MVNFYKVNGQVVAFISGKLSKIGYKHISHVTRDNEIDDNTDRFFIVMKDDSRKELKIVDV